MKPEPRPRLKLASQVPQLRAFLGSPLGKSHLAFARVQDPGVNTPSTHLDVLVKTKALTPLLAGLQVGEHYSPFLSNLQSPLS